MTDTEKELRELLSIANSNVRWLFNQWKRAIPGEHRWRWWLARCPLWDKAAPKWEALGNFVVGKPSGGESK